MKILLIRFSSIGDIVLTSPVIRCLKNKFPHAELHFVTKPQFKLLVEHHPAIHTVHTLDGDIQQLVLKLLPEKFDLVIDLHKNFRSHYISALLRQAFNSRVQIIRFSKLNIRKWLLTNFKINLLPDKSIVDRYFDGLKKIGVTNDGKGLDFFIPEHQEVTKDDIPMSHMLGYIAFSIGGQHETKKMPVDKWIEICKQIDFPIMLLGGKEDAEKAALMCAHDPVKIYNACGKFSLLESAHLIKKARVVVTHDTGLMHIAAAFKKPIISIWGNTTPAFGMFPYYGSNNVHTHIAPQLTIVEKKLSCRPCSKIGYATCPKKHFNCMNQLSTPDLVQQIQRVIQENK